MIAYPRGCMSLQTESAPFSFYSMTRYVYQIVEESKNIDIEESRVKGKRLQGLTIDWVYFRDQAHILLLFLGIAAFHFVQVTIRFGIVLMYV